MWLTNDCPQGGAKDAEPEGVADNLAVAFEAWCPNGQCYESKQTHTESAEEEDDWFDDFWDAYEDGVKNQGNLRKGRRNNQ